MTDVERAELCIRILVAYAPFEGTHSILRRHRFRAYDIGDLEVEGNIFSGGESGTVSILSGRAGAYSELDVARSICSSIWVVDANQPAIMSGRGSQSQSLKVSFLWGLSPLFLCGVVG
jgi:hypothetical protein